MLINNIKYVIEIMKVEHQGAKSIGGKSANSRCQRKSVWFRRRKVQLEY